MSPTRAATLRTQVDAGQYEDALGVPVNATRAEINRAHIRMLHACRGRTELLESLNKAKGFLCEESPTRRGKRLLRIGRTAEGLAILRREVSPDSDPQEHHLLGHTLYHLGRYAEALPYLDQAARTRGHTGDLIWLANTLDNMNRHGEALALYNRVIQIRGHYMEHKLAGHALFSMDRLDEARAQYLSAMKLGCTDPDVSTRLRLIRTRRRKNYLKRHLDGFNHWESKFLDNLTLCVACAGAIFFAVQRDWFMSIPLVVISVTYIGWEWRRLRKSPRGCTESIGTNPAPHDGHKKK